MRCVLLHLMSVLLPFPFDSEKGFHFLGCLLHVRAKKCIFGVVHRAYNLRSKCTSRSVQVNAFAGSCLSKYSHYKSQPNRQGRQSISIGRETLLAARD